MGEQLVDWQYINKKSVPFVMKLDYNCQ